MDERSLQFLSVALGALWCALGAWALLRAAARSPQLRGLLGRFRRARPAAKGAVAAGATPLVGELALSASAHRCRATESIPFCSICDEYEPEDAEFWVSNDTLTLKHFDRLYFGISHVHSPDVSYGNQYVEIRRTNAQEWVQLGSLASLSPWTARVAGHFELRGTATVDGRSFATPPVGIEVRFPEYDDIVSDDDVWFAMEDAWTTNLVETTPGNRREYGFWIRLDTSDGHYITAPLEAGIGVSASGGLLVPSPRPADVPSNPEPNATGVVYTVGHFHTHTPRTYIMPTNLFRRVGPSPRDCNLMKNNQMPGIVFDYVGVSDPDGNPTNRLYNGHGLDDPAMLYPVPPERRPTPCFP